MTSAAPAEAPCWYLCAKQASRRKLLAHSQEAATHTVEVRASSPSLSSCLPASTYKQTPTAP